MITTAMGWPLWAALFVGLAKGLVLVGAVATAGAWLDVRRLRRAGR